MFSTILPTLSSSADERLLGGRVRRTNACNFCREKKIKCKDLRTPYTLVVANRCGSTGNGESPCANCRDHGEKCVMLKRRRGRLKATDPRSTSLSARLHRIEETLLLSSPVCAESLELATRQPKAILPANVLSRTPTEQSAEASTTINFIKICSDRSPEQNYGQMCNEEMESSSIYSLESVSELALDHVTKR